MEQVSTDLFYFFIYIYIQTSICAYINISHKVHCSPVHIYACIFCTLRFFFHVPELHERYSWLDYFVSFMSEFHEVKCPDQIGRVSGNG